MLYVPKTFRGDPSDSSQVELIIDEFFDKVREEIEARVGVLDGPTRFQVELYGMHQPIHDEKQILEARLSDNYVRMLIYRTRHQSDKLVASVILRRTEGNYSEWAFSSPINEMSDDEL